MQSHAISVTWLTNTHKTKVGEFRRLSDWLNVVEGLPEATSSYSTAELQRMGMVGLYRTSDAKKPDA